MTESDSNNNALDGIFPYASPELIKFEKQMEKYFSREYQRWQGNTGLPEDHGLNSFQGDIANKDTHDVSVSHYDEEYHVYRAFLDPRYMAYTMGYFNATEESPEIADISLEEAQINKYKLLVERADIQDGQLVLDLGCGFGGLSKYLLQTFPNLKVVGINPSQIQTDHIRNVLIASDKDFDASRFTLIQDFFDEIKAGVLEDDCFDRVVSVGLLEHITNIDLFQQKISRVLKPGGKCLHHCIVSYDMIPAFLNSEDSLMGQYYPGAHIWPYKEPERHNTHLRFVKSWFLNGMNYWKTLDEWHKAFWQKLDQLYPAYLTAAEVDNWNKYFSLCKTMFCPHNGSRYGNGHYLYVKD